MQKEKDVQCWAFFFCFVRRQVDVSIKTTSEMFRKHLEKLSESQDKSHKGRNEQSGKLDKLNCLDEYTKGCQWIRLENFCELSSHSWKTKKRRMKLFVK